MENGVEYLKTEQNAGRRVAIYCAGRHGVLFAELLKLCGVTTDVFFDSDCKKWGNIIHDDIFCRNPFEITDKENYILLICIDSPYYDEVKAHIEEAGYKNVMNFNDVLDDIILNYQQLYIDLIRLYQELPATELFYTPAGSLNRRTFQTGGDYRKADRIAVYTGIFGGYDKVCEPSVISDNVDFYFISDEKPGEKSVFRWLDAKQVIPAGIASPVKRNRYIKMHPHVLFPNYEYSIYIDGNVSVIGDVTTFLKESPSGISAFLHPKRDCIFYEAITISNFHRVVAADACIQMQRYLEEGMPLHYGMPEMPVITRENNNPVCIRIMEDWWKEFDMGAQRDQLSFMYAMWKNGMSLSDMASLGDDAHKDKRLNFSGHYCESKMLANDRK